MKTLHINWVRLSLFFGLLVSFTGCDLSIQEDFEFNSELGPLITFEDMTAWEWVQTRTTPADDEDEFDFEEFDLMIQAIKIAGLVDEYNQTSTTDRTYIMLNNGAFEGGGDIIDALSPPEVAQPTLADVDPARLRTLLRYHIVTTRIEQVPTLVQYDVDYKFQTLVPGPEGEIYFRRDERYRININNSPALPSTRANERVRVHNYVYKNGIGHIISDYVRNVPF